MKSLNFREIIRNYLYDNEDFILMYDNNIYCFNYLKLYDLSDHSITIKMESKKITLIGNNFKIIKMTNKELLINGIIQKVNYFYDKRQKNMDKDKN